MLSNSLAPRRAVLGLVVGNWLADDTLDDESLFTHTGPVRRWGPCKLGQLLQCWPGPPSKEPHTTPSDWLAGNNRATTFLPTKQLRKGDQTLLDCFNSSIHERQQSSIEPDPRQRPAPFFFLENTDFF